MMRYVFIDRGSKAAESAFPVELFKPGQHSITRQVHVALLVSGDLAFERIVDVGT